MANENVIHDLQTDLYWEVKSLSATDRRSNSKKMTFDEFANDYINYLNGVSFGGFDDWRIPTQLEIRTLIDYAKICPALKSEGFANLLADDYWCGEFAVRSDAAWVMNLNLGACTTKNKTLQSYGIAVRGATIPDNRFVDNGDGTITDKYFKLMWQKDQPDRKSFNDVQAMLKDFELAGFKDWRLPTMFELNSIFDVNRTNGTWFFDGFEREKLQPPILQHITANTFEDSYIWVKNFAAGYDGYYAEKFVPLCYRLVRTISDTQERVEMPSSGQREIYDSNGRVLSIDPKKSATSFGNMEKFIVDLKTGIRYEKTLSNEKFTHDEALKKIESMNRSFYGGLNDWRLPTVDELRFIANYDGRSPAVFSSFENYIQPDFYWTCERHPQFKNRVWTIYFGYGCSVPVNQDLKCGCIAVSGGYENFTDKSSQRYSIENGVVIDKYLRLMWLRNEFQPMTVAEADEYFATHEIEGFKDWRIPDIKELSTIYRRSAENGEWFDKDLFIDIYEKPGMFLLARETFNGMFNWGANSKFAYDGYYADRLNGKYRVRAVRSVD